MPRVIRSDMQPLKTVPASGIGVEIRGVRREFAGGVVALDGLSLDVPPGQFAVILGPSGCGKSTLLRLIAGLDRAQSGEIIIRGRSDAPPTAGRSDTAYVFQDAHLLPWRTVLQNAALPLELLHVDRKSRMKTAAQAIERVGLSDAAERYPNQLSGGMRMRVSLARALVTRPRLLLLDEPFAALDEITRQDLDEQLREIWATSGMTVVFVTHSTSEAVFLAERTIVLSRRPGRVVQDLPISLPGTRTIEVRSTPAFAKLTGLLFEALEGRNS